MPIGKPPSTMISPVFSRVAIAVVCTMGRPAINPVAASAATEVL